MDRLKYSYMYPQENLERFKSISKSWLMSRLKKDIKSPNMCEGPSEDSPEEIIRSRLRFALWMRSEQLAKRTKYTSRHQFTVNMADLNNLILIMRWT
jgi:hypothetical protein